MGALQHLRLSATLKQSLRCSRYSPHAPGPHQPRTCACPQATVAATVERKDAEVAALRAQLEAAQAAAEVGAHSGHAGLDCVHHLA